MRKLLILTSILFTMSFCKGPGSGPLVRESFDHNEMHKQMGGDKHQAKVVTSKADVKIEPCSDCITIAKLLENKKDYKGKSVRVKGMVTKYNPGIMGKNWVHIQDGTDYKDSFDLTITTDGTASMGETVTYEGKIALEKDFGYGYFYDVIMEDAKPVN
jgi:hypothetical protein